MRALWVLTVADGKESGRPHGHTPLFGRGGSQPVLPPLTLRSA